MLLNIVQEHVPINFLPTSLSRISFLDMMRAPFHFAIISFIVAHLQVKQMTTTTTSSALAMACWLPLKRNKKKKENEEEKKSERKILIKSKFPASHQQS